MSMVAVGPVAAAGADRVRALAPALLGWRAGRRVIDVGPLEELPLGQGRAFVFERRRIAIFRQRDGRLFATDDRCPHRGGPLSDGLLGEGRVLCPLHGFAFDLATGCGPAHRAVVHEVHVEAGRVVVLISEAA